MSELETPLISDGFLAFARKRVAEAYSESLTLTASEMIERGETDGEGEPYIGAFPTWHYQESHSEPGELAVIDDLTIRIAGVGETDEAPETIYPFRREMDVQDALVGRILGQLHFEIAVQMNPDRPFRHLSDDELGEMRDDAPSYTLFRAYPNDETIHERSTRSEFARLELKARGIERAAAKEQA